MYVVQGSEKETENDIGDPDDVAIGRNGHIYVLDKKHKKVHVLNGDATYSYNLVVWIPLPHIHQLSSTKGSGS